MEGLVIAAGNCRGKSGLQRARYWITSSCIRNCVARESATETKPLYVEKYTVRVKR